MKVFRGLKKGHQLKALRDYVVECLHIFAECAMAGLACESSDKKRLTGHILLVSYVADIPEIVALLREKRGRQTAFLLSPMLC